jgi:hypothetical protein
MFAPRGWLKRPVPRMIYRTIEGSAFFDSAWYRATAMAAHEKLMDPLWHYLDIGWKKGSNPSAFFDTNYYLLTNPDVKDLGLNPLFHYLKYGVGEQRHPTQTGLQALHDMYGPSAPLRLLPVPKPGTPRVTLVIDDFTPRDSHYPYGRVLAAAVHLAEINDCRLRVLDRRTSPDYLPLADLSKHASVNLPRGWEVSRIALSPRYHEVALGPEELVIASSFSSDRALSSVPASRRHYIVSDWEPRLYGDSVEGVQASEALTVSESQRHVFASVPQAPTESPQWRVSAGPAANERAGRTQKKLTVGVDVDLLASGQMVAPSLAALESSLKQGVIDPQKVTIVLVGALPRPVNLLGSVVPDVQHWSTLQELGALAPQLDVLVSLARPHALGLLEQAVMATGGQVISRCGPAHKGLCTVTSTDPAGVVQALGTALSSAKPQHRGPVALKFELDASR